MFELNHVVAAGPNLRKGALHLQKLGFTLSRGNDDSHLRIVLEDGYLELREAALEYWRWSHYYLRTADLSLVAWALKEKGLTANEPREVRAGAGGELLGRELAVEDGEPNDVLPWLYEPAGSPRPQDRMEPERAQAAVRHANTALSLAGVMVLAAEVEPAVARYEQLLGKKADPGSFSDAALGVEGRTIPLPGGTSLSVVAATHGTGPAIDYQNAFGSGVFALMLRVQNLEAAAEALRSAPVYSFHHEGALVTSAGLPELGVLIFTPAEGD